MLLDCEVTIYEIALLHNSLDLIQIPLLAQMKKLRVCTLHNRDRDWGKKSHRTRSWQLLYLRTLSMGLGGSGVHSLNAGGLACTRGKSL
jgi:hypothetical protein